MHYFAFLGTGACDPNKDLKQLLAFIGVVAGWAILIFLVRKISKSKKSNAVKIALSVLLLTFAAVGTIIVFLATWLGLACRG